LDERKAIQFSLANEAESEAYRNEHMAIPDKLCLIKWTVKIMELQKPKLKWEQNLILNSMKSIRIRCNAISIRDENKCVDRKQINFTYNYKKASRLRSFFLNKFRKLSRKRDETTGLPKELLK
jgi:hypothetical protein